MKIWLVADRNMQCCWVGEGYQNGRLLVVEAADQNCIRVGESEADESSTFGLELEYEQEEVGWQRKTKDFTINNKK
jgi:hypothetical protein